MAGATDPRAGGTAFASHLENIDFAGKTGTAQVVSHSAGALKVSSVIAERPHAWFVGIAPRRNPDIVVAVLWEHGGWGSGSAHVAARVIEAFVNKQRRLNHNLSTEKQEPVEVGAVWSDPSNPDELGGKPVVAKGSQKNSENDPMRAGHFLLKIPHRCTRGYVGNGGSPAMRRFLSFRDFDWTLLGFVMILSIISIFEIYSATLHTKFVGFYKQQILWLLGGLVAMFVLSLIDYHRLIDYVHWIYGFCLISLVAVLVVGTKVLGARRWIKLPGGIHFQPSEWVKLVLIVAVTRYFVGLVGRRADVARHLQGHGPGGCPMLLVLKQPDLGTALVYSPILLAGLFLGGIDWKKGSILVLAGLLLVGVAFSSGKVLKPYQKQRLTSFMNPDADPKGSGYQINQSKIAVGDGGVFGRGATKGTQTQGDFLPIPYTDFIFAAFAEEHGFIGAVIVLLIYFLILMRLIQNAQTAADLPGTFLVMGVVAVLIFQIAVNVGMVIGLMPVTGIPLPLMSYGGSSVLFTFLALGMVMNVRMNRFVN